MDDKTTVTSHGVLVAFVSADPTPDICPVGTIDDNILHDPRATHRTQGVFYDRVCNVALQRVLPRTYPERRDTPLTSGRCARKPMGSVL